MTIAIASVNSAVERLLVVGRHRPGTVHRLVRDETLAGGKGVNVARVLASLGAESAGPASGTRPLLFGLRGGPTGVLFADLLASEGLAAELVTVHGGTRINEVLVDLADPSGATVYNAAGAPVRADELAALDALFDRVLAEAEALVCTGSLPPGVPAGLYGRWIARAREHGVLTVLDAHGEALARGADAVPDVVKVNREELAGLPAATPPPGSRGPDDPGRAVRDWLMSGVGCVIVTDGADPTLAYTPDTTYRVTSPRVPVRSAVGSGDAFCAGLVHSLRTAPEGGWERHLRTAAACGASNAASVTAGLSTELPPDLLRGLAAVAASPAGAAPAAD